MNTILSINAIFIEMTFTTSLDGLAKVITVGTTLLFAWVIGVELLPSARLEPLQSILISVLLLTIFLFCWLFQPRNYTLTDRGLTIHRILRDVHIDRNDIVNVREVNNRDTGFIIRTLGVGGLFGYFGKFSSTKLGSLTMYGTRRDKQVLIETRTRKIIVTPDHPHEFTELLKLS